MKKRILALVLATTLVASLCGCGGSAETTAPAATTETKTETATTDATTETTTEAAPAAVSHDEELTIEMYNVAANYQGLQTGWYGKILKDKFNLVIIKNIVKTANMIVIAMRCNNIIQGFYAQII